MKGKENMREWRRLGEGQDHNERQKDRTKERSEGNQNTAWRTRNRTASANLRHGSSSCIPFSQLEWLFFPVHRRHISQPWNFPRDGSSRVMFDNDIRCCISLDKEVLMPTSQSKQRIVLLLITYWNHCYQNSAERYGWHKQPGKEILSH